MCETQHTSGLLLKMLNYFEVMLTILTGKDCVLFNSVQEWLVGCFLPF